jgi:excisionase family DNA binding protein
MSEFRIVVPDDFVTEIVERVKTEIGPPAERSPYMTIPEAADYLRASRQAVDDLLRRGKLARHKRGRCVLVRRSELEALVREQQA